MSLFSTNNAIKNLSRLLKKSTYISRSQIKGIFTSLLINWTDRYVLLYGAKSRVGQGGQLYPRIELYLPLDLVFYMITEVFTATTGYLYAHKPFRLLIWSRHLWLVINILLAAAERQAFTSFFPYWYVSLLHFVGER